MAQSRKQKTSSLVFNKKDAFKSFDFKVYGNIGINQTATPEEVDDAEALQIFNMLPIGNTLIRKINGFTQIAQPSTTLNILKLANDTINNVNVMLVILADGSAGTISNGTYTQFAPPATFSTDQTLIDITTWQGQYYIIVDANKGLFAYQPNWTFTPKTYSQNTLYNVGDVIQQGSTYYYCITSGTSNQTTYPTWAASTAYAIGATVVPTTANGYYYKCTTAGTSGSTQPTWTTTVGGTVTDGTVVWTCYAITTTNWNSTIGSITVDGTVVWQAVSLTNGLLTISPSLTGSCVAVWNGRLFIANGRIINYSAAGSFIDFTANDNGGYFTVTNTNLKTKVEKMIGYIDSLYIIGDHAIISMTGTTTSNDPNTWYQTELFNSIGVIYPNSVCNYNNTLYVANEYGIFMISSTQAQKIDYKIDLTLVSFNKGTGVIAQINNLMYYLLPVNTYSPIQNKQANVILAYCIDLAQVF
ncbi:MAG: hypothetical protein QXI16_03425, partial [Sulfolobaceae archaeon]